VRVVPRRVSETKNEVREVLRVGVGADPAGLTERVEEGAIKTECIASPQEKTRNHEKERATRCRCKKNEASVTAGDERREE
jgi:hypothetical protein